MKQFQISTEEKLQLENSILKIDNANLTIQAERARQDVIINNICSRLGIKREDITNFDIQTGVITATTNEEFDTKQKNE